jgi:hypothetical protein
VPTAGSRIHRGWAGRPWSRWDASRWAKSLGVRTWPRSWAGSLGRQAKDRGSDRCGMVCFLPTAHSHFPAEKSSLAGMSQQGEPRGKPPPALPPSPNRRIPTEFPCAQAQPGPVGEHYFRRGVFRRGNFGKSFQDLPGTRPKCGKVTLAAGIQGFPVSPIALGLTGKVSEKGFLEMVGKVGLVATSREATGAAPAHFSAFDSSLK